MRGAREQHLQPQIEKLISSEWGRVVRLCARLSGSPDAAEDLAQETMIEAWCHAGSLRNPDAMGPWLPGIARNVCLRWRREQGREAARLERVATFGHQHTGTGDAGGGADLALERDELSSLLARALHLIPAASRDVLVQHYIAERPHREIAETLGLTENAVGVRIHRGRQALKEALARPEIGADAVSYGLVDPDDVGWQETRVWCPFCGRNRLALRIETGAGRIVARCTGSCSRHGTIIGGKTMSAGSTRLKSVKAMLRRELLDMHDYYRRAIALRGGKCPGCGRDLALRQLPVESESSPFAPSTYGILLTCHHCDAGNSAHLSHLLLDTPLVQQFWREHPRMEVLPVRRIERDGRPALLSGFASLDATARVEMVSDAVTYKILHVDGFAGR
jgi:RNA polymerase sigma factor (sigma-70 family)